MQRFLKKLPFIILMLAVLAGLSCSKQEAPSIRSDEVRGQREIERLEACSSVNFSKGVLLHSNMLLLFKCTKWNEEFPFMYQAIKNIQRSSWDHMIAPIDKEFVENLERRDRLFKNIRDLDSKNGLDDLSRVLVALNETNFFDSLKMMFKCVENSQDEICDGRKNKIPTKRSLQNIIKLVDTDQETINGLSSVVKALNIAIGSKQEELRAEINKFKDDPVYIAVRLKLVDALASKMKAGLTKEDREFLSKIFLTGNAGGDLPWLYTWIHDAKMDREKFKDLVEYPILKDPRFLGDFKALKSVYNEGFSCSIKDGLGTNELINFDFKTCLGTQAEIVRTKDKKSYYDYISSVVTGMKISAEVCKELESNKHNVNFIKTLANFADLLGEKKFYELARFLAINTNAKGDLDKDFTENLYFLDLLVSDVFFNANGVNEQVIQHTRDFYPVLFDAIKNLPPKTYTDIGQVAEYFLKKEQDEKFVGIADFWNFFTSEEKNFLFKFVDRHFDDDTQYVLLFDFYSKFLNELRDVQPFLKESWMGNSEKEEMSYLSLQDVFYQLAGKETLMDFKKFFGRDQILRVLEVISNGSNINTEAKSALKNLYSGEYIARSKTSPYIFSVKYAYADNDDYEAGSVVECMKKFADIENGFYFLVRRLPEACSKITTENISFKLFGWLNSIESTYKEFNPSDIESDTILSKKGILSPYMLNTTLGTMKLLDSILGEIDSVLPTKNGIEYLLSSTKYHLHEKHAAELVEKNLVWFNKLFEILPEQNLIYRNALVRTFAEEENFFKAREVTKNIANLSMKYSDWVKSGKIVEVQQRSLGKYDPSQDCEKVINKTVAPNPCPTKDTVKKHTKEILKYLSTLWEKEEGTAISHLLKSLKPGEGLDIPLDGSNTTKYSLTLKETFKYLYDTSDKSFPVNTKKIFYMNDSGKGTTETVTTLERVETVIREVRFDNNYLGVAFLNAVTHASNYNEEVDNRKGLLEKCLKIPVIRCSRRMSDDDLRMAQNALETFDSLSDVNNGHNADKRLKYGNFLKTFEQTLVGSSAKAAQEVQLFALKDEELLQHNGRLLGDMTMMTMWSNAARVIRDRVGRTRDEFDKFIESDRFNRVNKALLYGFDLPQATPSAERLITKLRKVPTGHSQTSVEDAIDWVASLNYDQTRLLEDTVARLLLVGSYLGPPDVVFGSKLEAEDKDKYKDNNLLQIFLALEKVVDYYATLKDFFPKEMQLIEAIKPLNTALVFLTDSLSSTNIPEKNTAYLALNDIFSMLQTVLFEEMKDPRLATFHSQSVKGLDLVLGFVQNPKNVNQTYHLIKADYDYLNVLHENQGSFFKAAGMNANRVVNADRIDLTPFRDYLMFTTKSEICFNREVSCMKNYQFDEVANFSKYLGKTSKESGKTYFMVGVDKLLVENFDQLIRMIDEVLPSLKIKSVKPPFAIN